MGKKERKGFFFQPSLRSKSRGKEYMFDDTGVKEMKWTLPLTRCHYRPVTEGHEWLEMALSEW